MSHILAALTRPNRLAIITSLVTGLRISDVLNIKADMLSRERFTVTEKKTLKKRYIRLPTKLRAELKALSGLVYVFEHRTDPLRPRTRQAVYKDIKRAARAFRVEVNVAPHSARKIYAVNEYKKDMDIKKVQKLLNHSDEAVTLLYCMADQITERALRKKKERRD
jgi:integrase